MAFIYHLVPTGMIGETLYPLASLHKVSPELHDEQIKKLNCVQAEVLHFSPIHPGLMFQGLKSVFPDYNRSLEFYEIPIERLEGLATVFYDMNKNGDYVFGESEREELYDLITPLSYQILTSLPPEAIAFYQEWKDRGINGAPAMGRIPHVMVKGEVSVAGCRTLDWSTAIRS